MVFQRPVLLRRSALANVAYALRVAGVARDARESVRAREALRKVGLEALAERPARVLSGGEQQRLALARAWALQPEVLFLDEPTASLDPGATHEIEKVIAAMHAAGTKIVMVTHNLGQARRLGDEILFLHQGRLAERAAPIAFSSTRSRAKPPNFWKENCHGSYRRRIVPFSLHGACRARPAARRRSDSSPSPRPRRPSSRACSATCCRSSSSKTGIKVRVVALGTGQALDVARRGDADVVFVHARAAEEKFLAEGQGVKRFPVMYNDFVLIGPKADPAKIAGSKDILAALRKVRGAQAPFVSRGDRSGTHMAELDLWKAAGIDIDKSKGPWYRDTGQGMGPALNTAASMNAYILADRGTWLAFKNRGDLDDPGRGRQAPVQPVRRDAGQSRKASEREKGARAAVHRLAGLARRAEGDRRLQDQRRAAVLSECESAGRMRLHGWQGA